MLCGYGERPGQWDYFSSKVFVVPLEVVNVGAEFGGARHPSMRALQFWILLGIAGKNQLAWSFLLPWIFQLLGF